MKNFLIFIAFIPAAAALYFFYIWYKSDFQNKESLPTLLSAISAFIMFIVAWRYDGSTTTKGGSFFSFNRTNIKGSGNTVNQATQDNPTIDIKKTSIDGDKNKLDQGKTK